MRRTVFEALRRKGCDKGLDMSSRRQWLSMFAVLLVLGAVGACNAILGIEAASSWKVTVVFLEKTHRWRAAPGAEAWERATVVPREAAARREAVADAVGAAAAQAVPVAPRAGCPGLAVVSVFPAVCSAAKWSALRKAPGAASNRRPLGWSPPNASRTSPLRATAAFLRRATARATVRPVNHAASSSI